MSVVYGKHRGVESGHGLHPHRRHLEDVLDRHAPLERRHRPPHLRRIARRPEHDLGLRRRRDDVGRDAAVDQADGVVRLSEHRIGRQRDRPQLDQRVDQLVDRRLAELGKRRVRGAAAGAQPEPEDAARREAETVVGRLAVDQKPRAAIAAAVVRHARAVAAALLADDEHQADARFAVAPQLLGRRDLRRENPFRVARAAAEQPVAFDAAGKERRHAVEMGGEHDAVRACGAVRGASGVGDAR